MFSLYESPAPPCESKPSSGSTPEPAIGRGQQRRQDKLWPIATRIAHLRITHHVSYPEVAVIRIADLDGDVFGKGQQRRQERLWLGRQNSVLLDGLHQAAEF